MILRTPLGSSENLSRVSCSMLLHVPSIYRKKVGAVRRENPAALLYVPNQAVVIPLTGSQFLVQSYETESSLAS